MADTTNPTTTLVTVPPSEERHSEKKQHSHKVHAGPNTTRAILAGLGVLVIVLAFAAYHERSKLSATKTQLGEATTQLNQSKTDLDTANTKATALQQQLDEAKAQSDDQQKQLNSLQGQKTDLQAQLTKSQADWAALSSQLDKSKQLVASLQTNVAREIDAAAKSQKQADLANAHAVDLQTMLDKAINDASKPDTEAVEVRPLPVSSSFEKASWGGKYTLHIRNQLSQPLRINVSVDKGAVSATTVQPGAMFDVSSLKEGSSVVVSSDGFASVVLTAK
jgi:myosin heavy subunit